MSFKCLTFLFILLEFFNEKPHHYHYLLTKFTWLKQIIFCLWTEEKLSIQHTLWILWLFRSCDMNSKDIHYIPNQASHAILIHKCYRIIHFSWNQMSVCTWQTTLHEFRIEQSSRKLVPNLSTMLESEQSSKTLLDSRPNCQIYQPVLDLIKLLSSSNSKNCRYDYFVGEGVG